MLADSEYTADISLFGNGPHRDNYYYIQYHPALNNTLLGLRILQADMMLIDPTELSAVPKLNGQVVLGLGEQLPSRAASQLAADQIRALLTGHPIQSWVLTDINTQTTVQKTSDGARINASPYYYFWTSAENNLDILKMLETQATTKIEKEQLNNAILSIELQLSVQQLEDKTPAPGSVAEGDPRTSGQGRFAF